MKNFIIDLLPLNYYICHFENFQSLNLSTNNVLLYSTATQEAVKPVINTFDWTQLPFPLLLTGLLIYGGYMWYITPSVPKPGAHVEPPINGSNSLNIPKVPKLNNLEHLKEVHDLTNHVDSGSRRDYSRSDYFHDAYNLAGQFGTSTAKAIKWIITFWIS